MNYLLLSDETKVKLRQGRAYIYQHDNYHKNLPNAVT